MFGEIGAQFGEVFHHLEGLVKVRTIDREMSLVLPRPVRLPWKGALKASGQETVMVLLARPECGLSEPLMMRINVDLPAPLCPKMLPFSSGLMVRSTWSSMSFCARPW